MLQLLTRGVDGVRAFVSGILWELAASPTAAQQLLEAGAVPVLMGVVRDSAAAAGAVGKKGGKGNKQGGKGDSKGAGGASDTRQKGGNRPVSGATGRGKGGEGPTPPASVLLQDPAAAAAVALCNATGERVGVVCMCGLCSYWHTWQNPFC